MSESNLIKTIIKQIKIFDLAEEIGLDLEKTSGRFDYRCRCPAHSSGRERTPSLYINTEQNSFYCFGCSKGSNVIDFYMLMNDASFHDTMQVLKEKVNPDLTTTQIQVREKNNFTLLLKLSSVYRRYLRKYPEQRDYIYSVMKKSDEYIESIPTNDIKATKKLISKIQKTLKEKLEVT